MTIIFVLIVLLILVFITAGYFCIKSMTAPKVWDREHELQVLPTWGYDVRPFLDSVEPENFEYRTNRGYTLRGFIIRAEKETRFPDGRPRAVLLVHGYTGNRYTMLSYAECYHSLGFNVVEYDHRYHGESDKVFCSMGYYESLDAVEIAEHVKSLFPENTVWGIHGESMGSATTMLAAPELKWMDFVCEDCGFTTLKEEIAASISFKAHLPPHPIAEFACLILRLWRGFSVKEVRPVDSVPKISQPMLFVHGGLDRFVPTQMVFNLYDAKIGEKKRLRIFDDVPHAKSVLMHHEEYSEMLEDFLSDFGII